MFPPDFFSSTEFWTAFVVALGGGGGGRSHHRRHLQPTQGHRGHRSPGMRYSDGFRHQAAQRAGGVAGKPDPASGGPAKKILRPGRIHAPVIPLARTVLRDRRTGLPGTTPKTAPARRTPRRRRARNIGGRMTHMLIAAAAWLALCALIVIFNIGAHR